MAGTPTVAVRPIVVVITAVVTTAAHKDAVLPVHRPVVATPALQTTGNAAAGIAGRHSAALLATPAGLQLATLAGATAHPQVAVAALVAAAATRVGAVASMAVGAAEEFMAVVAEVPPMAGAVAIANRERSGSEAGAFAPALAFAHALLS